MGSLEKLSVKEKLLTGIIKIIVWGMVVSLPILSAIVTSQNRAMYNDYKAHNEAITKQERLEKAKRIYNYLEFQEYENSIDTNFGM